MKAALARPTAQAALPTTAGDLFALTAAQRAIDTDADGPRVRCDAPADVDTGIALFGLPLCGLDRGPDDGSSSTSP